VAAAVQDGLLKGYSDGSFRPQGDATGAEACAMIGNFLKLYLEKRQWHQKLRGVCFYRRSGEKDPPFFVPGLLPWIYLTAGETTS
jgi:hypothetical protein